MIPGEIFPAVGDLILNADREAITLMVANTGDRPVQVGSHYHFLKATPRWILTAQPPMAVALISRPAPQSGLNQANGARSI